MREFKTGKYLMALNAAYSRLKSGGYSAKLDTLEEPEKGYMVGIKTLKKYPNISSVNVHEMVNILAEEVSRLDSSILYIGSWLHPTTREPYFELSINIDSLDKALNVAKIHDQEFIHDVVTNNLITVDYE